MSSKYQRTVRVCRYSWWQHSQVPNSILPLVGKEDGKEELQLHFHFSHLGVRVKLGFTLLWKGRVNSSAQSCNTRCLPCSPSVSFVQFHINLVASPKRSTEWTLSWQWPWKIQVLQAWKSNILLIGYQVNVCRRTEDVEVCYWLGRKQSCLMRKNEKRRVELNLTTLFWRAETSSVLKFRPNNCFGPILPPKKPEKID